VYFLSWQWFTVLAKQNRLAFAPVKPTDQFRGGVKEHHS
jgi:hypothetical protein